MTRIYAVVFLLIVVAGPALGAEWSIVEVTQPMWLPAAGPIMTDIPYIGWFLPSLTPGLEVELTVAANSVQTPDGLKNVNGASQLRLHVQVVSNPHTDDHGGLFGDTLRVILDMSEVRSAEEEHSAAHREYRAEEIVPATVQCMLRNAKRHWPRVRFLSIEAYGDNRFAKCAGVYTLEGVRAPQAHEQWLRE